MREYCRSAANKVGTPGRMVGFLRRSRPTAPGTSNFGIRIITAPMAIARFITAVIANT